MNHHFVGALSATRVVQVASQVLTRRGIASATSGNPLIVFECFVSRVVGCVCDDSTGSPSRSEAVGRQPNCSGVETVLWVALFDVLECKERFEERSLVAAFATYPQFMGSHGAFRASTSPKVVNPARRDLQNSGTVRTPGPSELRDRQNSGTQRADPNAASP
jgi:hypothetical protein